MLGLLAGIWAKDKFDQARSLFRIFSSCRSLFSRVSSIRFTLCPAFWQSLSHFNPFFYMIKWVSLRLFRAVGYRPGLEPKRHCGVLRGVERIGALGPSARIQAAPLRRTAWPSTSGAVVVTPEYIESALSAPGPRLRARRGRRRRPALSGGDRERRAFARASQGQAAPARVWRAGRQDARGDPRAVDADAYAGAVVPAAA